MCSRISWSTISNAFCKFKNIPQPKLPSSSVCLILSERLIRVWVVEYFGWKPNCNKYIRLLMSRKLFRLLHISFSMKISILDRRDIGLQFVSSTFDCFFIYRYDSRFFQDWGKFPSWEGQIKNVTQLLRNVRRILFGPVDLCESREDIVKDISFLPVGIKKKVFVFI